MYETPKFLQNNFSISFPRVIDIRRKSNAFEDTLIEKLKGHYSQPLVISIPDEMDPEVPRLVFGSKHGYNEIIISQISMGLNVKYSTDWQTDIEMGKTYLMERVSALFHLADVIKESRPYFSGLTTQVRISAKEISDDEILQHLSRRFLKSNEISDLYDIQIRLTAIRSSRFYRNSTIKNFRRWREQEDSQSIYRLSASSAFDRGIELTVDFNDRFSFNQVADYFTSEAVAKEIIETGIDEVKQLIKSLMEGYDD